MNTTITLGDAGLIIIGIALLILIFYCILLVRNLIPSVKTLNRVLEDAEKMTGAAVEGVEEAQRAMMAASQSISSLSASIKEKEGILQTVISLTKTLANLIAAFKNKNN